MVGELLVNIGLVGWFGNSTSLVGTWFLRQKHVSGRNFSQNHQNRGGFLLGWFGDCEEVVGFMCVTWKVKPGFWQIVCGTCCLADFWVFFVVFFCW